MPHVAPDQVLPTNPCDEQIATKNSCLLAPCVRGLKEANAINVETEWE